MSGLVARVLVILFGLSFGCGLVREMISRHRNAKNGEAPIRKCRQQHSVERAASPQSGLKGPKRFCAPRLGALRVRD